MISGKFLRALSNSGTSTTAIGIISNRTISQTFLIGTSTRINASNQSLLQTAFFHKTAHKNSDDKNLTAISKEDEKEMDESALTKTKIAEGIAHDYDISRSKAERIISKIFSDISQNIIEGKRVSISGFGAFTKIAVKERKGRNPQTGDPIIIPSGFKAKFTSFPALTEKINSEH